jgi:hypothetical protein
VEAVFDVRTDLLDDLLGVVRVREAGRELGLALEALNAGRVLGPARLEDLQRDVARQPHVVPAVHLRASARANPLEHR